MSGDALSCCLTHNASWTAQHFIRRDYTMNGISSHIIIINKWVQSVTFHTTNERILMSNCLTSESFDVCICSFLGASDTNTILLCRSSVGGGVKRAYHSQNKVQCIINNVRKYSLLASMIYVVDVHCRTVVAVSLWVCIAEKCMCVRCARKNFVYPISDSIQLTAVGLETNGNGVGRIFSLARGK